MFVILTITSLCVLGVLVSSCMKKDKRPYKLVSVYGYDYVPQTWDQLILIDMIESDLTREFKRFSEVSVNMRVPYSCLIDYQNICHRMIVINSIDYRTGNLLSQVIVNPDSYISLPLGSHIGTTELISADCLMHCFNCSSTNPNTTSIRLPIDNDILFDICQRWLGYYEFTHGSNGHDLALMVFRDIFLFDENLFPEDVEVQEKISTENESTQNENKDQIREFSLYLTLVLVYSNLRTRKFQVHFNEDNSIYFKGVEPFVLERQTTLPLEVGEIVDLPPKLRRSETLS